MSRGSVDRRRDQLLAVAREAFERDGYEAVAVQDLARAAGVSVGLLYHYFGGKRGMYLAVVEGSADELLRATAPPEELAPEAQLRHGLEAHLDYVSEHARGWTRLLTAGADEDVRAVVQRTREAFVLRAARQLTGGPPSPLLAAALHGWLGYVDGVTLQWLRTGEPGRPQLVDLLVASFGGVLHAVHTVSR